MVKSILNINKRGNRANFSWLPKLEMVVNRRFGKKIKKRLISLALVKPQEIRYFNRVYRRKDEVTDVLSFSLDSPEILGEILICLSQARLQAKAGEKMFRTELQLLTIHGLLHLLGYDHEQGDRQAQQQSRLEQTILDLIN
jgi:probable rRNA maturation factor